MEKAFFNQQELAWEPRVGFAYQAGSKTTIRGGFGMFADYFPAQIMGDLVSNIPNVNRFTVLWCALRQLESRWNASRPDSGHAQASASNDALNALFPQGGY